MFSDSGDRAGHKHDMDPDKRRPPRTQQNIPAPSRLRGTATAGTDVMSDSSNGGTASVTDGVGALPGYAGGQEAACSPAQGGEESPEPPDLGGGCRKAAPATCHQAPSSPARCWLRGGLGPESSIASWRRNACRVPGDHHDPGASRRCQPMWGEQRRCLARAVLAARERRSTWGVLEQCRAQSAEVPRQNRAAVCFVTSGLWMSSYSVPPSSPPQAFSCHL